MIGPGEIVRPYYLHLRVLSPLLMSAGSISSQNEEDLGDHIPCKIFTVNSVLFNKNVLPKFIPIGAPAAIENDSNDNDNRNYGDINEDWRIRRIGTTWWIPKNNRVINLFCHI